MKASNRIRIGHAVVASFAFLAITLGNSAAVRADIIVTFVSTTTGDYSYNGGGLHGPSTLTTSPSPLSGTVGFGSTFTTLPGGAATITLNNIHSTTAATAASQTGFMGSYTITLNANHADTVTVTFTNATLTNNVASGSFTFGGSAVITDTIPGSATLSAPENFSLGLSGATANTLGSFGFTNFTADDVNTASASTTPAVPEPSTMAIAGLGALGMIGYGLRRRKALGA
jgi:hypothetical protein